MDILAGFWVEGLAETTTFPLPTSPFSTSELPTSPTSSTDNQPFNVSELMMIISWTITIGSIVVIIVFIVLIIRNRKT